ncbi:carbohydrate kinase family protein [Methanobacterium aggregans]|uniref:carbohydrate kinase family protein n=1 Tax=Methanobacterium aggregans TaxID=1615586 RepID=UPI001FD92D8B|nr:carbohydrate kinase family protein [Methanobacterium aggregans]MBP2046634.1 ribokinase [Methanobacterium aggregans]
MNDFKRDVAALGTCNMDFIMKVSRFIGAEDEADIQLLLQLPGGSAANFALGTSRMGLKTGIMARVGNDHFGSLITDNFQKEGVDIDRLLSLDEKTGMGFIAVDPNGERSIYTFMGANAQFTLLQDDVDYIRSSRILHITGIYLEVLDEASKHANTLSLNPGTLLSHYGWNALKKVIKKSDVLFLNKKEVELLTGMHESEGAQFLIDEGVPLVVLTRGKDGAVAYTDEGSIKVSTNEVESIDTTGAGDAFAAGFISSLIKKQDIEECLKKGNNVASQCIQRLGG